MIEFGFAWAFLLLPLPLLVYFFIPRLKNTGAVISVPFFEEIRSFESSGGGLNSAELRGYILLTTVWILLTLAVAKPQLAGDLISQPKEARNIMLAVDVSESMKMEDMSVDGQKVDRLSMVKSVLSPFIDERKGDRLGLILFGSQAYLQSPLTLDYKTIQTFLDEARIGIAGPRTAIGDAIGLSLKRLIEIEAKEHVLILLTDGQSNMGVNPLEAAQVAASQELKIFTIGVGSDEVLVNDFFGTRKVNPSQDLDEAEGTLAAIAQTTGGKYFRAKSTAELRGIYESLDKVELTKGDEVYFRPKIALFHWPLTIAFLLISFSVLFRLISRMLKHQTKNENEIFVGEL